MNVTLKKLAYGFQKLDNGKATFVTIRNYVHKLLHDHDNSNFLYGSTGTSMPDLVDVIAMANHNSESTCTHCNDCGFDETISSDAKYNIICQNMSVESTSACDINIAMMICHSLVLDVATC